MNSNLVFTVREAGILDAPEIARLNSLFNGSHEPAENYARRLVEPGRVDRPLLAEILEQDGVTKRVIGLANLRLLQPIFYAQPYAELTEMVVEEAFRRRGVGRALLAFAVRLAQEAGAHQMLVLTDFYNHPAQELYRSMGFGHYDIALAKGLVENADPEK